MADRYRTLLIRCRGGWAVPLVAAGVLAARPARAQRLETTPVWGAVTLTQPVAGNGAGDVSGYVVIDPSRHALAPWASAGLRWEGLLARDAHPIANVGLRFRRRSLRMALGISRDVAYGSLRKSSRPSTPVPIRDWPYDTLPVTVPSTTGVDPFSTDSGGGERTAYVMQSVTDLVSSLEWSVGRVAAGAQTGWRLAGPAKGGLWYSASLATPLIQNFVLVAGMDRRYDHVFSPGKLRTTLGLQWRSAPWHRSRKPRQKPSDTSAPGATQRDGNIAVVRVPNGIRLTLAAPRATRVEIRSDLTGWNAVPLQQNVDGRWQLDLAAPPGLHRLALRIDDGAWLPPPGLPVGSDGYGATVGLLVLES